MIMKKILFSAFAAIALCACSNNSEVVMDSTVDTTVNDTVTVIEVEEFADTTIDTVVAE